MPAASPPTDPGVVRRRPYLAPVLAALFGLALGDAFKPAADQAGARLGVGAIDLYRATVSKVLARTGVVHCRFEPTCSEYGRQAISRYGWPRGLAMTAGRVLRCNPWAKGGSDPVP
jgi:uncharacterized protein